MAVGLAARGRFHCLKLSDNVDDVMFREQADKLQNKVVQAAGECWADRPSTHPPHAQPSDVAAALTPDA